MIFFFKFFVHGTLLTELIHITSGRIVCFGTIMTGIERLHLPTLMPTSWSVALAD